MEKKSSSKLVEVFSGWKKCLGDARTATKENNAAGYSEGPLVNQKKNTNIGEEMSLYSLSIKV